MEISSSTTVDAESQRNQSNIFQFFQSAATTLSDRYERQERLKKLGRDVTFESKHVIFLLQRCANASESEKAKVFAEADERVQFIDESKFKEIAREVCGLNGDLYARSYDWGVEEYIEALTFLTYLRERRLLTLQEIQYKLCFRVTPISSESGGHYFPRGAGFGGGRGRGGRRPYGQGFRGRAPDAVGENADARLTQPQQSPAAPAPVAGSEDPQQQQQQQQSADAVVGAPTATATAEPVEVRLVVMPLSYLLGVADLTGELMRFAVTRIPRAPLSEALALAAFTQQLATALHRLFGLLPWNQSQAARKVSALVTNVLKARVALLLSVLFTRAACACGSFVWLVLLRRPTRVVIANVLLLLAQIEHAMYVREVRGKQMNLVLAAPALLRHLERELHAYPFDEANAGDSEDAAQPID